MRMETGIIHRRERERLDFSKIGSSSNPNLIGGSEEFLSAISADGFVPSEAKRRPAIGGSLRCSRSGFPPVCRSWTSWTTRSGTGMQVRQPEGACTTCAPRGRIAARPSSPIPIRRATCVHQVRARSTRTRPRFCESDAATRRHAVKYDVNE